MAMTRKAMMSKPTIDWALAGYNGWANDKAMFWLSHISESQ